MVLSAEETSQSNPSTSVPPSITEGIAGPNARPSTPSEDASAGSHSLRSSTPPTEVSSTLSSPVFAPLKGWAMLADECSNPGCFGVPLVRPPRPSADGLVQKECVACKTLYLEDADGRPRTSLTPSSRVPDALTTLLAPSSSQRQDRYSESALVPSRNLSEEPIKDAAPHNPQVPAQAHASQVEYSAVVISLNRALLSLSQRMDAITNDPSTCAPATLGELSDTMAKVARAIQEIRQL